MSIRNFITLGSHWASVTDFKRIQTPHSLRCGFGGDKTFATPWSGGRVQVWVQVWAPAGHLAISPKAVPWGRGQNQRPSSWGRSQALLGRVGRASTNTGRFLFCGSHCGPRQGRLRKTYSHFCDLLSSRVNKVLMPCKFRASTSAFLFIWNDILMELARCCFRPKPRPSLHSIFRSVIGLSDMT